MFTKRVDVLCVAQWLSIVDFAPFPLLIGNQHNGCAFRDAGGTMSALELTNYQKPRRMALRIITQLILLEGA